MAWRIMNPRKGDLIPDAIYDISYPIEDLHEARFVGSDEHGTIAFVLRDGRTANLQSIDLEGDPKDLTFLLIPEDLR